MVLLTCASSRIGNLFLHFPPWHSLVICDQMDKHVWHQPNVLFVLGAVTWCLPHLRRSLLSTPSLSTSGWDGCDDEQHKGRRRISDGTGAAVHSWPLQEIFHSTLQEPGHQWEGSHSPDPAEHPEGEHRQSRSKVNHCATGSVANTWR